MHTPSNPTPYETFFGGVSLTVAIRSPDVPDFTNLQVKVRILPIADWQKAFESFADDIAMCGLYVGEPIEWVHRLAPADFTRIVEEGRRLNADFFAWCSRREAAQTQRRETELRLMSQMDPSLMEKLAALGQRSPGQSPSTNWPMRPV